MFEIIAAVLFALDAGVNLWAFLQTAVTVAGTAFAAWLTFKATVRKSFEVQNPKLDQIHTLVNGNLDAAKRENRELRALLEQNGIEIPPAK